VHTQMLGQCAMIDIAPYYPNALCLNVQQFVSSYVLSASAAGRGKLV